LAPERVRVLPPVLTREPPVPVIVPANVVSEELEAVRILPAVATVELPEALVRLVIVAPVVVPVMSSVVEAARVTLEEEAIAPDPERARVPPEIVVEPL
jgi:hypothetical protein